MSSHTTWKNLEDFRSSQTILSGSLPRSIFSFMLVKWWYIISSTFIIWKIHPYILFGYRRQDKCLSSCPHSTLFTSFQNNGSVIQQPLKVICEVLLLCPLGLNVWYVIISYYYYFWHSDCLAFGCWILSPFYSFLMDSSPVSLLSSVARCSRIILYIFYPKPETNYFCKNF